MRFLGFVLALCLLALLGIFGSTCQEMAIEPLVALKDALT